MAPSLPLPPSLRLPPSLGLLAALALAIMAAAPRGSEAATLRFDLRGSSFVAEDPATAAAAGLAPPQSLFHLRVEFALPEAAPTANAYDYRRTAYAEHWLGQSHTHTWDPEVSPVLPTHSRWNGPWTEGFVVLHSLRLGAVQRAIVSLNGAIPGFADVSLNLHTDGHLRLVYLAATDPRQEIVFRSARPADMRLRRIAPVPLPAGALLLLGALAALPLVRGRNRARSSPWPSPRPSPGLPAA